MTSKHQQNDVQQFEIALAQGDIVASSTLLQKLYNHWDELEHDEQKNVKSLESVYLSIVHSCTGGA